jgi:hypothetical protein
VLGFFTTITAVKIDKAVTTKDKAWPTSTYSSRVSMQGLRGEGSNPHNSGGAFSEWFCQREATWWTYLRQGQCRRRCQGAECRQSHRCDAGNVDRDR